MEIDEVIAAIYSGNPDDACERLSQYFDINHSLYQRKPSICHRIDVAASQHKRRLANAPD
jgi:hypothetical protein